MKLTGDDDIATPDQIVVTLPADHSAPALARQIVGQTLLRWSLPMLVDAAALAVSEITTNAVLHGEPPLQLRVLRGQDEIRVEVHDTGRGDLRRRTALGDAVAEGGRGLAIVTAISLDSGVDRVQGDGKWVYATFRRPISA